MIFYYELPYLLANVSDAAANYSYFEASGRARMHCMGLMPLFQQFRQLKLRTETHLQHQLKEIYGMLQELPERVDGVTKRGIMTDFFGEKLLG